jgi:hypothetical protein
MHGWLKVVSLPGMASTHLPSGRPFTYAEALAAGISPTQLQSSAWRQIFRGVWVDADAPDSRELRLAAARLLIPRWGVLCGLTAAWIHGADVRRLDDFDVHVGFAEGQRIRKRPGFVVCQETLDQRDICLIDDVRVTTPLRTVFDCLRLLRGADRLVVADAMTHLGLVSIEELRSYFASKRRLRNLRVGEQLIEHIEPLTESPMETRLRLVLVDGGLPRPEAQHEVFSPADRFLGRLDFAYPDLRVGVEYDGADHWKQRREDDRRRTAIRAADWEIYVYSADDVFRTPLQTAAEVMRALRARAA